METTTPDRESNGGLSTTSGVRLLGVIVAVGALVRIPTLGMQSLWYDEYVTFSDINRPLDDALGSVQLVENGPPLYFLLMWGWARIVGFGDFALRLPSAVLGTLTILVAYAIGRRLMSARTGLIAAALVAVNPQLVWYSQEARNYALFVFIAGMGFLVFLRALDDPKPRTIIAWTLLSMLSLATHYFAAVFIGAEAIWLLWRARPVRREVLLGCAQIGVLATGLLSVLLNQPGIAWIEDVPRKPRIRQLATQFLGGVSPPWSWLWLLVLLPVMLALGLTLTVEPSLRRRAMIPIGVAAIASLPPTAASLMGSDYLLARNYLPAAFLLIVVLAAGLSANTLERGELVALGMLIAIWSIIVVAGTFDRRLQRPDWDEAITSLGPADEERLLVIPGGIYAAPALRYAPRAVDVGVKWGRSATDVPKLRAVDLITVERPPGDRPCWFGAACALGGIAPHAGFPAPGFRLVEKRLLPPFKILRYRAAEPTTVDVAAFDATLPKERFLGHSRELTPVILLQKSGDH